MKKITTILLPLLMVTSVFADSAFTMNLKYGSRGQYVVEMQEFLIDQGFLTGSPTGNFYAMTLKAVKAFQSKNGLSVSGFFGPLSRQKANELTDLTKSDEEAKDSPVVENATKPTPVIQQIVQPVQYIYTPAPIQNTVPVTAPVQDVYNLKLSQVTLETYDYFSLAATLNGNDISDQITYCWVNDGAKNKSLSYFYRSNAVQTPVLVNIFGFMGRLMTPELKATFDFGPSIAKIANTPGYVSCDLKSGKVITD